MAEGNDDIIGDLSIVLLSGAPAPALMKALDSLAAADPEFVPTLDNYRDPDIEMDEQILVDRIVLTLESSPSVREMLAEVVRAEVRRTQAESLAQRAAWVMRLPRPAERAAVEAVLSQVQHDFPGRLDYSGSTGSTSVPVPLSKSDSATLSELLSDEAAVYASVRDAVSLSVAEHTARLWQDGIRFGRARLEGGVEYFARRDPNVRESFDAFMHDMKSTEASDRFVHTLASTLRAQDAKLWTLLDPLATGEIPGHRGVREEAASHDPGSRRSPITLDAIEKSTPDNRGGRPSDLPAGESRESPAGTPPGGRRVEGVLDAHLTASAVVGTPVTFIAEIASEVSEESLPGGRFATNFPPGMHRLPLRLELASNDFDIDRPVRAIVLRSDGTSEAPIRFTVTPKSAGARSIMVSLVRDSVWLANAKFTTNVAEKAMDAAPIPVLDRVAAAGDVESAPRVGRRPDFTVTFTLQGKRFNCTFAGTNNPQTAYLPITSGDLAGAVAGIRAALESLAENHNYQRGIQIGEADTLAALTDLRSAGSEMLRTLFFTRETDNPLSAELGREFVTSLADAPPESRVVILIEGYSIPWHALYLQKHLKGDPSPDLFLGLRHVLSERMVGVRRADTSDELTYDGNLSVALHLDARIDKQQGIPIVQHQLEFWEQARKQSGTITLYRSSTSEDAIAHSLGAASDYHVLYFVCHAGVKINKRGDPIPALAWLGLPSGQGQDDRLTHRTLSEREETTATLRAGPLVFINACESAELSPEFYKNFATYFLERGARTLIGTECKIATFFADEFAQELFGAVLSGWAIGDAMLHVRKTMLARGNALGLAYGLHGSADTMVVPQILTSKGE